MCLCCVADSNVTLLQLFLHVVGAATVRDQMSHFVLSADRCLWWTQLLPLMSSAALRLLYPSCYCDLCLPRLSLHLDLIPVVQCGWQQFVISCCFPCCVNLSLWNVSLHVFFDVPPVGVCCIVMLGCWWLGRCKVCPAKWNLLYCLGSFVDQARSIH